MKQTEAGWLSTRAEGEGSRRGVGRPSPSSHATAPGDIFLAPASRVGESREH